MTATAVTGPDEIGTARPLASGRRALGQGMLLVSGFAAAHSLSLLRNSCVGYALSRGHFGTAASITLVLQMLEVLSDLGPDRLLLQARPEEQSRLLEAAHALTILRGIVLATMLLAGAAPLARFFGVPDASGSFALAALVPLIRGFSHMGFRLAQRRLDNAHYLTIEVVSQAAAVVVAWPLLSWRPLPDTVVGLMLLQAGAATLTSHTLASEPYRAGLRRLDISRLVRFGWPIWLSALPLLAASHFDRMLVGRFYGMEQLAGFTAGTMLAMIPALVVARLASSLLIPLVADRQQAPDALRLIVRQAVELAVLVAGCYAVALAVAGGPLVALVFGPRYHGLEQLIAWLGAMFAVRMIQAVPGMTLMAAGLTRPLLGASLVRAAALPMIAAAALLGMPIEVIAAAGLSGEVASLAHIILALERHRHGLGRDCALRSVLLLSFVAALVALPIPRLGLAYAAPLALVSVAAVALALLAIQPALRQMIEERLGRRRPAGPQRRLLTR